MVQIDSISSDTPRFDHRLSKLNDPQEGKSDVITNLKDPNNYVIYTKSFPNLINSFKT